MSSPTTSAGRSILGAAKRPGTGRPVLFLDIDGVLNRIGPEFPRARPEGGRGAQLHIPEGMGERVRRLAEDFDVVWASAWGKGSHKAMAAPLGLPKKSWPHVGVFNGLKLPKLIDYAGERPWAWVDDRPEYEGLPETPFLILETYPEIGLTEAGAAELIAFAHGAGSS